MARSSTIREFVARREGRALVLGHKDYNAARGLWDGVIDHKAAIIVISKSRFGATGPTTPATLLATAA